MFTSAGYLKVDRSSLDGSMEKIPVAPGLQTSVSENYTLGYLRHLLHADELLGQILLSMHNVEFLMRLCDCAREAIQKNSYEAFRRNFWQLYVLS
jgi:queuine tRNA-ribosyltransferase